MLPSVFFLKKSFLQRILLDISLAVTWQLLRAAECKIFSFWKFADNVELNKSKYVLIIDLFPIDISRCNSVSLSLFLMYGFTLYSSAMFNR